ncbi:MAG: YraN family protein [Ruminococcaceae bacterium]|nr:YraN family protein [Oscillospiraceae bacterium]MBQ8898380.1 YraN family protein [Clostridia bacterium]
MGKILFKNSGERGRWGEQEAAKFLRKKGWTLLAAGYRTRHGELDLICEHRGTVIIVEVKTRSAYDFARGIDAVSPHKINRMKAAALAYLASRSDDRPVRFDVIEVLAGDYRDEPPKEITHHENVYTDFGA